MPAVKALLLKPGILLFVLLMLPGQLPVQAADPVSAHPLFKLERSKNANVIQYDAQVTPDGRLSRKDPVVGYWIRLAEQGQRKELTWTQRTFAFGFKTKLAKDRESLKMQMKLDLGAPILVVREGDSFRAAVPIEGNPSWLEKIFIDSSRKGLSVDIRYVELFGTDRETGEARYQKIVP